MLLSDHNGCGIQLVNRVADIKLFCDPGGVFWSVLLYNFREEALWVSIGLLRK
jgi:hypothetical protein